MKQLRQRGAKTAFKNALKIGSIWSAYNHLDNKHLGVRTVGVVQSNSVAFKTDKGQSWLPFDQKSSDYANPAPGVFQVYEGDTLILTYELQLTPKSPLLDCGHAFDDDCLCQ